MATALQAFVQAHDVTDAAGVAADMRSLLTAIASHDQSDVLTEVRATTES